MYLLSLMKKPKKLNMIKFQKYVCIYRFPSYKNENPKICSSLMSFLWKIRKIKNMIVYMFFLSPYEKAKKIKYQKPKNMSFFLHNQKIQKMNILYISFASSGLKTLNSALKGDNPTCWMSWNLEYYVIGSSNA